MGLGDLCNTTLVLGLGLTVNGDQHKINKTGLKVGGKSEPCLSLGLCERSEDDNKGGLDNRPYLCRQESVTSSSRNGVVLKREREVVGSEEAETERVSSRVSDEDDDGSNSITKKLRLSKDQSGVLEENFKLHSTLNPKQKQELARKLNLRARQVEVWFQNRRARTKVKQTEVDCKYLKKCCETLTEENQRLKKELQELKSLKLARPLHTNLYMHMPPSTLTMCPSCETISDNGDNNKFPKSSLVTISPKGRFVINPFGKPSTAC